MTNVGKWDRHYAENPYVIPMGASPAYKMGAEAFRRAGCHAVEDWGCGYGWFEVALGREAPQIAYTGVDGSNGPTRRVIDDLVTRTTSVDGIFMRAVLEHNYDWEALLDNALRSVTKTLVLALFTPFADKPPHVELRFEDDFGVPTLALHEATLYEHFEDLTVSTTAFVSPNTAYGIETLITVDVT